MNVIAGTRLGLTAERTLNPAAPPLSVVVNWQP